MQKTVPDDWEGKHVELSRAWIVWHVLEHDLPAGRVRGHNNLDRVEQVAYPISLPAAQQLTAELRGGAAQRGVEQSA